jgi:hypothetical protein
VTAKAHGGAIDIQGVTVATVNDKLQLQSVRTWFDPMDMFRQIAPNGVVKKDAVDKTLTPGEAIDSDQKVEIDQKPRPTEAALATVPEGHPSVDAQELMAGAGCPFAGTNPKEAAAPFPPAAVDDAVLASGEADKISHPNLPLRDSTMEILKSGEQEGAAQDPNVKPAPNTSS